MTAPFGRRTTALLERRTVGAYVIIAVRDDQARPQPGQFYMLAAAERWGGGEGERPFLARAVSILRAADDGTVEFLLEDVGPGTRRLCELDAGDQLLLSGPFGNGFAQPAPGTLLVGGGIGIAPLLAVQERWGGRALLGFRDAHHAQGAALFEDPEVATDDGSRGHRGFVTELLERELDQEPRAVYACGPPALLEAIGESARRRGIDASLALEAPMACGFGACYGCVVATADGYRRVCVDGPVFEAAALR
ncbi:MAG TPA: dihydroorotate dehydrogenase electron transfer subunit [Solirubrobacteraceae bacterium]|nr:dihydroorotate dehydrogenase electron transfer subunit [Solirubrobacteraceae bacterium]